MTATSLLTPADCTLVLVDEQAGLAFAAGSADRQSLRSNAVALLGPQCLGIVGEGGPIGLLPVPAHDL